MYRWLIGILTLTLTGGVMAAEKSVPVKPTLTATNDTADRELEKLMEDDDTALAEVDGWIQANDASLTHGNQPLYPDLNDKIRKRLDPIRARYKDFLKRYPNNADGHLAYGTFLEDTGDEDPAGDEYEIARKLDPKNPAAWNNLANYFGDRGPVTNSFVDYAKAIELNPTEPVYYQNFATTVYLFRKDAKEFYHLNESQVFDKALDLYRQAMRLAPTNFDLATDYAESFYGIRPSRTNDALASWTNALKIAEDEFHREGVYIHLARWKINFRRFDEAQAHLNAVTNEFYASTRKRLQHLLDERLHPDTNSVVTTTNIVTSTNSVPPGK